MAKLIVDYETYFKELKKEKTEFDMNAEVEDSNPDEWLYCRLNQLNNNQRYSEMEMRKARESDFLGELDHLNAKLMSIELYGELRTLVHQEYERAKGIISKEGKTLLC